MKRKIRLIILLFCCFGISKAATITFNKVFLGTGTTYTLNSSSLDYTTAIVGSSFKFTSANPADVTFSGNNVAGQLSYISGGQTYYFNGVISRKVGNQTNYSAFYFVETTVLGNNTVTGKAWLLIVPTSDGTYTSNNSASTNSAPVNGSLNDFLTSQSTNRPPVINSNGGGENVSISLSENISAVTTVTATDPDAGDTKAFSITGGADASKFTINASTGVLTFLSAPNYENPTDAGKNNVYDVQVTVTDAQGATDIQAIAVAITNLNDSPPVITSNGGGATATINILSNSTVVTTVKATDADYGDVLTFSKTGGENSNLFNIDASSGALTFIDPAVNGTYYVNVTVTDANGNTDVQNLTIVVSTTDITAPSLVITSSDGTLSVGEVCTISFKFSELIQGFVSQDVVVTGGTLGAITQSGTDPTLYTASFTQSGTADAPSFNVYAGTYTDLATPTPNAGLAASLTLAYDVLSPTVTISFSTPTISIATTSVTTFTFTEDPGNSFSLSDVTVQNGKLINFTPTADPKVWQATLLATSSLNFPVVTVQNLSYTDLAGNLGSSATKSITLAKPTIDLNNDATSDTGISSSDNITSNNGSNSSNQLLISGKAPSTASLTIVVQFYNPSITSIQFNNVTVNASDSVYTLNYATATAAFGTKPVGGLLSTSIAVLLFANTSTQITDFVGTIPFTSNTFVVDNVFPTPTPTVNTQTTYDQTPTITGTATVADNEAFTVTVNSVVYTKGDGQLSLNGTNWTLIIPIANRLSPTTYSVIASVTDAAGNATSDATTNELVINASNVTIDLENTSYSDTGASSTDNITANREPILTGTASGSDTTVKISVLSNGITYVYGSVAITDGTYSLNLSSTTPTSIIPTGSFPAFGLPAGTVNLTVEGNTSGSVGANSFTIEDIQTSNIVATPTFTTAQISWTKGSRSSRVVFMKEGTGAITNPTNFTFYAASANWTLKGTQSGTSGYYCIYNGSDANGSVLVSGLYPGLTYTIQAFEYDGNTSSENYLTNVSGANNPNTVIPWPSTTFTNSIGVSTPEAWNTAARWNHDTIPSTSLHPAVLVYIDGNCEVTNSATTHNLTIMAAHDLVLPTLTILPEKLLQVTGTLGGQLINNGDAAALVIKADEIKVNGSLTYASGSPQATVEMYSPAWWNLNEIVNSKYNWQFMSIPVQSIANVTSVFDGGYVRVHNEAGWGAGLGDVPLKRWTQLPNGATMQYDKCYEIVQPSPRLYTFTGALFNGNINRSLSYTPKILNVQGEYPGQHLIGNPYTAAIDITQIQFGANMEETVYIYNTGTFNSWGNNKASSGTNPGQYVAIPKNIATQTTPIGLQRQIPSMQAFLVKCTAASTIDITYSTSKLQNSERQRSPQETTLPWLRIELKGANKGNDMLWLFKKEGTSREFDNGWDGYKINGDIGMPRIFDSELISNYQINTLPDLNETKLGFRAGTGETEYTLNFENYNMDETYSELFLFDIKTNQLVDIRNKSEYNFTATNTTTTEERFKILTYRPVTTSSVDIKANVFHADSKLTFQNYSNNDTDFILYNMSGQQILSKLVPVNESLSIDIELLPGVYICKILSKNQSIQKKVYVK